MNVIHVSYLSYNSKLFQQDLEFLVCRECSNGSDVRDMTDIMFEGSVRVFFYKFFFKIKPLQCFMTLPSSRRDQ